MSKHEDVWGSYESRRNNLSPIQDNQRSNFFSRIGSAIGDVPNPIKAIAAAVVLIPTIVFGSRAFGLFSTPAKPLVVASQCQEGSEAKLCVDVVEFNGKVHAATRFESLNSHSSVIFAGKVPIFTTWSDPANMQIDGVDLRGANGQALQTVDGDHKAQNKVAIGEQTADVGCPPAGTTLLGEARGQYKDGDTWRPLNVAVATVSDGKCGPSDISNAFGLGLGLHL